MSILMDSSNIIIVANEKGGVGKSLTALALIDRLSLDGHNPAVIQIDRQRRLANALGGDILTIESDAKASRLDPALEIRRFSPLLEKIEISASNNPIIVDVGAGEVARFAAWAALVDLEEELNDWQLKCHLVIPFLAEAEAIRQAAWTAERLRAAIPRAVLYFAENRRDGSVAQLHPSSAAAGAITEHLESWYSEAQRLAIPAIPSGSWRCFEAANCRLIDIVDMSTVDAMRLTGLPRAEAKIVRGDVTQWLVTVFDEFDRTFCAERI